MLNSFLFKMTQRQSRSLSNTARLRSRNIATLESHTSTKKKNTHAVALQMEKRELCSNDVLSVKRKKLSHERKALISSSFSNVSSSFVYLSNRARQMLHASWYFRPEKNSSFISKSQIRGLIMCTWKKNQTSFARINSYCATNARLAVEIGESSQGKLR